MFDLLLLLADATAESSGVSVGWGTLLGVGMGLATALGTAIKVLWAYWTKREEIKRTGWVKVVEAKDVLIASKDAALAKAQKDALDALDRLRQEKDAQIEELSKKLSLKSDEHAKKIQELMELTLSKQEEGYQKMESLLDRSLNVQADFAAEVRRLNG